MVKELFTEDLTVWLKSNKAKTLAGINEVFGEKSFAVVFFLLMSLSATPIPTGGLTNVMEIIVILLSIELIIGRRTIWIPQKLLHKKINKLTEQKVIPFIIKRLQWFEKYSSSKKIDLDKGHPLKAIGFFIFIFTLASFIAPPFSGLDTLPSIGVVTISLALLFKDLRLLLIGVFIGSVGTALVVGLGRLIYNFWF